VAVWEYQGEGQRPKRHVEPLGFEAVPLQQRSYK
jgi:succinate dehydrogenase / fumarate reductase flavoprotein subunit